jgi:hypothetical protein
MVDDMANREVHVSYDLTTGLTSVVRKDGASVGLACTQKQAAALAELLSARLEVFGPDALKD